MITLHPSSTTSYDNNGYGSLRDLLSGKVVEEVNGQFELEITYPVWGVHYNEILMRNIIYAKPNPFSEPQPFRIYAISKPINMVVTVNAAHISYDMSGFPVSEFTATSPSDTFVKMKANVITSCPFTFNSTFSSTGEVKVESPRSMRSILGNNLLKAFGGEYEFDGTLVRHVEKRGANRGVKLRYGKNLTDVRQDENMSNVYTAVYPYWIGYTEDNTKVVVKLPEKTVPVEGKFDFERVLPLDVGENYTTQPTEEQLRDYTKKYITNNKIGIPSVEIEASFVQLLQSTEYQELYSQLEEVRLGDTMMIEFPDAGIMAEARCVKTIYDIPTDSYGSLELGDAKSTLATTIAGNNQAINDKLEQQKQHFDAVIGNIKIGLAEIDILIADKANIKDLEATNIKVQNLTAEVADIDKALIDKAEIKDLEVVQANIQTLTAEVADIDKALIGKADITDLEAVTAKIGELEVDIAKIATLEVELGAIKTLVNGNLTSENIHSMIITADKFTVEDAFIKDAMVDSMSIEKLKAGKISTTKFEVGSDSGNLNIKDNTIQISDSTKVRVQVGKDASGDYSLSVWDASGKLIFDARGITEDSIKEPIIRNDMISENANISGSKLDIDSVITEVNNGTTKIKGTTIALDEEGQTLDVAFKEMTTTVDGVREETTANTTQIGVQNGQIKELISNTTIVKDGETTQLKDAYNQTVSDVDSMKSTISDHTTSINEATGKINNVETHVNEVSRTLEGTVSTIESHTQSITAMGKTLTTNSSSIEQLQKEITLKVSSTEAEEIAKGQVDTAIQTVVKSVVTYYGTSSSATVEPTSWSTAAPEWRDGVFIWTKTTTTLGNGKSTTTDPVCITGAKGQAGAPGGAGNGIKTTAITYQASTSGITAPTGEWTATIPSVAENQYLWTRTVITYTNGTNSISYSVGKMGAKGPKGDQGDQGIPGTPGKNGLSTYFHIKYSAVSNPTTSSQMTETPDTYIGTYVDNTATDSTDPKKYTWARFEGMRGEQGIPGTNGSNGKTSYLHIKYSNDNGKTFTANNGETPGDYIGQYTDFTSADSNSVSAYKWSLIKGAQGAPGQGVVSIITLYKMLNTKEQQPTPTSDTGWETTSPTWKPGMYIHVCSKITYKNPTTYAYTKPMCDSSWEAVNEIEIGGRNLLQGTTNKETEYSTGNWYCVVHGGAVKPLSDYGLAAGDTITYRAYLKPKSNASAHVMISYYYGDGVNYRTYGGDKIAVNQEGYSTLTLTIPHDVHAKGIWFAIQNGDTSIVEGSKGTYTKAKVEKGNKATDWTPAPEDIDTAIKDVDDKAEASKALLADMANDNKLTAVEKQTTKVEWDAIVGEYPKITAQANKYGVSVTTYKSKYDALNGYITPLLSNLTTTSNITGTTFRANFTNYYNARQDLLNSIAIKAKDQVDGIDNDVNIPPVTVQMSNRVMSLNDSVHGKIRLNSIEGNTIQNIFKNVKWSMGSNNASAYMNVDWSLLKPNTNYTFIYYSLSTKVDLTKGYLGQNFVSYTNKDISKPVLATSKDVIPNPDDIFEEPHIYPKSGQTFTDADLANVKLMVLEGDWTNKERPIFFEGIQSVGNVIEYKESNDDGTEITKTKSEFDVISIGKNLLPNEWSITGGSDKVIIDDGGRHIRIEGGMNTTRQAYQNIGVRIVRGKTYTISWEQMGENIVLGTVNPFVRLYPSYRTGTNKAWVAHVNCEQIPNGTTDWTRKSVKFVARANEDWETFEMCALGRDFTGIFHVRNIQIEEASNATDYEPYQAHKQTITMSEPLRKLPNGIRDYIDPDRKKIIRRIGKIVLNGNDNTRYTDIAVRTNTVRVTHTGVLTDAIVKHDHIEIIANNLIPKIIYGGDSEGVFINRKTLDAAGNVYVSISKTKLKTHDLTGVKEWLRANPIIVYYELQTPVEEDCKMFKYMNQYMHNTLTINNTSAVPTIDITYAKSLKDNMEFARDAVTEDSDAVYDYISNTTSNITRNYEAYVKTELDKITLSVTEKFATKDDTADIRGQISSLIKQTAKDIEFNFKEAMKYTSEVDGKLQEEIDKIESYIRFDENGITLGKVGSSFTAVLTNERLSFMQGEYEVAYLSNYKMFITDVEIKNKLTLGDTSRGFFDFIPRSNGNLSLKWRAK